MMKKNKKFLYIWLAIRKKHPDWSKPKLRYATLYSMRSQKGTL